jgi:hypothetical protein
MPNATPVASTPYPRLRTCRGCVVVLPHLNGRPLLRVRGCSGASTLQGQHHMRRC